ncbi:hypothetical protein [African swine fever virus]
MPVWIIIHVRFNVRYKFIKTFWSKFNFL